MHPSTLSMVLYYSLTKRLENTDLPHLETRIPQTPQCPTGKGPKPRPAEGRMGVALLDRPNCRTLKGAVPSSVFGADVGSPRRSAQCEQFSWAQARQMTRATIL